MERVQFRRRVGARGFSLIELLIVISIILVILAVAVPKLNTAKENANEMVVIREIQTIHQAQTQYQSQFGKFAATLAELGPPTSGGPGPQAADLIPGSLASGEKDGYVFTLTATPQGYTVNANPKVYNSSGRRTFYSDQTMTIHQNWSAEAANASSPEFGGK
ncbi:MAG TPA: prepilin-type N-terminal cleavage/methylation domain-containing protein [Bryobacteraceae bacterium]|nr:prepilin-type N-terminal cleavage/methylation domain-containing protein [Bryobacteraceae bacterium]